METTFSPIIIGRSWSGRGRVWPTASGSLAGWPIWSARQLLAGAAGWTNQGWFRDQPSDLLSIVKAGEDAGGAGEFSVLPAQIAGAALCGPQWDAALAAILAAQAA